MVSRKGRETSDDILDEHDLAENMKNIFEDVQVTMASHRRHILNLRSIMLRAEETEMIEEFNGIFCRLISKILPVKKTVIACDRVVKFISSFIVQIKPKDEEQEEPEANDNNKPGKKLPDLSIDENLYSQFLETLFNYIFQGIEAKNAMVRYRVCHIFSHIMYNLNNECLELLREHIHMRLYDINVDVRVKAVAAYAAFQNNDYEELSDAGKTLRFIMQNDERAEVRREALLKIEKNEETEGFIIERAIDIDKQTRKILYSKILPSYKSIYQIDPQNRLRLIEWGLRDKEDDIRNECKIWLTTKFLSDCNNDLFKFMEALSGIDRDISSVALGVVFEKRPEFITATKFANDFFNDISTASALLARVYYEYCHHEGKSDLIEMNYPEASTFASILNSTVEDRFQNAQNYKDYIDNDGNADDLPMNLKDPREYNFILLQLLKIAIDYDYADEFGRSRMYNTLRKILSEADKQQLPNDILDALIECFRKLAVNEHDFCQVAIEIVTDLKDKFFETKQAQLEIEKEAERAAKRKIKNKRLNSNLDDDDEEEEDDDDDDNFYLNDSGAEDNQRRIDKPSTGAVSESEDSDDESEISSIYHSAIGDMTRQSAMEAEKSRKDEIEQVKYLEAEELELCLSICRYMLRLVFSPLRNNVSLINLHNNFIVPCLNERSEVEIRILALECHGLCGLLDKDVAVRVMVVAAIFVTRSEHEEFIEIGIKVMCDLLATHGIQIVQVDEERSIDTMAVAKVFYKTIKNNSIPEAQAIVAEGLFKLFFCNTIDDAELLEMTLLRYFDPTVLQNEKLRHCLEFCIPTYSFAKEEHQALLTSIVEDTIRRLFRDWENISALNNKSWCKRKTTVKFILDKLSEWTCPYNLALISEEEMNKSPNHADFALGLLRLLRDFDPSDLDHKKNFQPLVRQLNLVTLAPEVGVRKLKELTDSMNHADLFDGRMDDFLSIPQMKATWEKFATFVGQNLQKAEEMEGVKASELSEQQDSMDSRSGQDMEDVNPQQQQGNEDEEREVEEQEEEEEDYHQDEDEEELLKQIQIQKDLEIISISESESDSETVLNSISKGPSSQFNTDHIQDDTSSTVDDTKHPGTQAKIKPVSKKREIPRKKQKTTNTIKEEIHAVDFESDSDSEIEFISQQSISKPPTVIKHELMNVQAHSQDGQDPDDSIINLMDSD